MAQPFADRDFGCGMFWIGHPGALLPLADYVGEQSWAHVNDEPVVQVSMGGGVRARQRRVRAPRRWQVTIPLAHADEVANLRALLTATLGPYVWVTPEAQVSNVLTPEVSVLKSTIPPLALGGSWPVAGGGVAPTSRLNPSRGPVWVTPAPVPPSWTQRKVTVSAMLATSATPGARVVLQWLDAAGSQLGGGIPGGYVSGMDGLRRSFATGQVPSGAVSVRVEVQGAEVIAQPAVTWTDAPVEWDVGNGASRVLVHGLSKSTPYSVPDNYGMRRGDFSFTVTEIGPMS